MRDRDGLDCTFIAVGHGCSVLVELPGGKNMLYDVGQLGSPEAAARSIAGCLWSRGITHLDAVVISHADVDHYNALPALLEQFSVGVVYVSPVMFDEKTPALQKLSSALEDKGVPLREIWSGDRLTTDDASSIEVLHPSKQGVLGSDNANSIVLSVEYAGRRILLTGDLESPGLEEVLAESPLDCDVVMAPHHGSRHSDPHGFSTWTTPEWTVISGGFSEEMDEVQATFQSADSRVLHTATSGAVRISIAEQGELEASAFRR
jgi:competence protein ComEC